MKETAFVFLLIFAMQCKDSDYSPTLQEQISGEWVRNDDPTRHYLFADDYATSWIYNFGTTIAPKWYKVEEAGYRKLMLVEINTGDTSHWIIGQIVGDTLLPVNDVTNSNDWFEFYLKRE